MTESTMIEAGASFEMDMDEFIDHDPSFGGGGEKRFLTQWKDKKEERSIDIWIHPRSKIHGFYAHSWHRTYKSKDGVKIGLYRFNSMESEEREPDPRNPGKFRSVWRKNLLGDDGRFLHPSETCPFGRTLNWVADQIADEKIDWCDEIFRFQGDGKDKRIVYAGGFTGLFDSRGVTEEQFDEIYEKTGITKRDVFQHVSVAKLQFLFQVIREQAVDEGTKIMIESNAVSRALKTCVKNMKLRAAKEAARKADRQGLKKEEKARLELEAMNAVDPLRSSPICFSLINRPTEKEPSKKYDVLSCDYDVTEELKAQFDKDPPDVSDVYGLSNVAELRRNFEEHWSHAKVVPPWDDIFAPSFEKLAGTKYVELPSDFNYGANAAAVDDEPDSKPAPRASGGTVVETSGSTRRERVKDESKPETKPEAPKSAAPAQQPPPADAPLAGGDTLPDGVEMLACDNPACKKPMRSDALLCPHCGAEYAEVEEDGELVTKLVKIPEPKQTVRRAARRAAT